MVESRDEVDEVPSLANFLGPLTLLDLTPNAAALKRRKALASSFGLVTQRLPVELRDFTLPIQEQTNWCWAAVGCALTPFFHPGRINIQCDLASSVVGQGADCCAHPELDSCNQVARISDLLARVAVSRRANPPQPKTPVAFSVIADDIGRRLPIICLMTHRQSGVSHFMVLVGADRRAGVEWVAFDDPAVGGRYWRPLSVFENDFRGWYWEQSTRLAR